MAYELKVGDTKPNFVMFLQQGDGSVIPALNTALSFTVNFKKPDASVLTKDAVLNDQATGEIEVDWVPGDISVAGKWSAEARIEWDVDDEQRVPSKDSLNPQFDVYPAIA